MRVRPLTVVFPRALRPVLALTAVLAMTAGVIGTAVPAFASPPTTGTATHLFVSAPTDFVAGQTQQVTFTAEDGNGVIDTSYSGEVSATISGGQTFYVGGVPNVTLVAGTGTLDLGTTVVIADGQTLHPSDTDGQLTSDDIAVNVHPGATASLSVVAPAGISAGQDFTFVVDQFDAFGNPTAGDNVALTLTNSDASTTNPNGVTNSEPVTARFATDGDGTITATDQDNGAVATVNEPVAVASATTATALTVVDNTTQAGQDSTLTITAVDGSGNTVTIPDLVTLTDADTTTSFPGLSSVNGGPLALYLVNGVASTPVTFHTAGLQIIDATAGALSGEFNQMINAGPAAAITLAAPATVVVGAPFTIVVTPRDADGNAALPDPSDPATATWSDGTSGSATAAGNNPTSVAYASDGTATFTGTFTSLGVGSVTVGGTNSGDPTASLSVSVVTAGAATQLVASVPGDFAAGQSQTVTIYAEDANGNIDHTYSGAATASMTGGASFFPGTSTTDLVNGVATIDVGGDKAGAQTLTIADAAGSLTPATLAVTVDPGPLARLVVDAPPTVGAGQDFTYGVTQFDAYGNVTTGTQIQVALYEFGTSTTNWAYMTTSGRFTAQFPNAGQDAFLAASDVDTVQIQTAAYVHVGPAVIADHLQITSNMSQFGTPGTITISAVDSSGATQTVDDTVTIGNQDNTANINGGNPTLQMVNGTVTFPATFWALGNQYLIATGPTSAGPTLAGSLVLPIGPGPVTNYAFTAPATVVAGAPYTISLTASDGYGHPVDNATDPATISWTDGSPGAATPDSANATSADYVNGIATFTGDFTGTGTATITIGGSNDGDHAQSTSVTVTPGAATQLAAGAPANFVAGATQQVTVDALDAFGNLDTSYTGTATIALTGQATTLPGGPTLTITAGVGTIDVGSDAAGAQTLTATDTAGLLTATGTAVIVDPGPVARLNFDGPATVVAGEPYTVLVTAFDNYGNPVDNAADPASISWSDGTSGTAAHDPINPNSAAYVNGVATITGDFTGAGTGVITVGGSLDGDFSDSTSVSVTPVPGAATHLVVSVPGDFTAGSTQMVTLTAVDDNGNTDIAYAGTATAQFSAGVTVYPGADQVTLVNGVGTLEIGDNLSGDPTLDPYDIGGLLTGDPLNVTVWAGPTASLRLAAPIHTTVGQDFTYTVTQLDAYGNVTLGDVITMNVFDSNGSYTTAYTADNLPMTASIGLAGRGQINAYDPSDISIQTSTRIYVGAATTATHLDISFDRLGQVGQQGNLTITAVDDAGVTLTIGGAVTVFDANSASDINDGTTDLTLVNGTVTVPATFWTVGDDAIFASSSTLSGSTLLPVLAGPVWEIDATGAASVAVGDLYTITVTPFDAYGNQSFDTSDPAAITWSGSAAADASNPTSVSYADGVATITGTFTTTGTATIDIAGQYWWDPTTQATVTVTPAIVVPPTSAPTAPTAVLTSLRVGGSDQFGTATAVSVTEFPAGKANAVVLARSGDFADSTPGVVLAAAKNAPLLFTTGDAVPTATLAEITRVLPAGGTVYVLGGTAAIPASVATALVAQGYVVMRLAGADRYATSVAVAIAVGGTGPVFLATGTGFADALAAGPAAAASHGVVLLTDGGHVPASVQAYLAARHANVYAVGGQAAAADSSATAVIGADRYATAVAVAKRFFAAPASVGVASGTTFPDALSGGAYLAHLGGPLLLTAPNALSAPTVAYLRGLRLAAVAPTTALTFGGVAAVSPAAQAQINVALAG